MKPAHFLMTIWSDQGPGYFCISTKSKAGGWRDTFFRSPLKLNELRKFIEDNEEKSLYFCATAFSQPRRKKEFVTGSMLLWSDMDEADPRKVNIRPQIAWESSPKRYAALWRLNQFHKPDKIEEANRALTYSMGADKGGWDLTQVLRIPGTKNYKYRSAPRGKLMWCLDSAYSIKDFPKASSPSASTADPLEVLRRCRRKLKAATYSLLTAKKATMGKRSEVIWRLENEMIEQGISREDVLTLIKASVWNKFAGRRDEDEQLRRELSKVSPEVEDLGPPPLAGARSSSSRDEEDEEDEEDTSHGPIVRMSEIEPEHVTWLWYPYIPRGKLTLLEGDPGLGKSWVTMALAAFISRRIRLPGSRRLVGGKVLIMSAEDGLGDTVRPRLDQLRGDVTRIFAYDQPVSFDEEGCAELEEQIKELRPVLVICDPLVAYLGGNVDIHKANETREVMARLARIAERYRVAIVAVRHLTKGSRDKSIYRGIGSIDLTAAARSVLLVGLVPDDERGRAIVHIKCNLAPLGPTVQYELNPASLHPFRWTTVSNLTAEDIFKVDRSGGGVSEYSLAKEYLTHTLEGGPKKAADIRREAEGRGISAKILGKVAQELGVKRGDTWKLA